MSITELMDSKAAGVQDGVSLELTLVLLNGNNGATLVAQSKTQVNDVKNFMGREHELLVPTTDSSGDSLNFVLGGGDGETGSVRIVRANKPATTGIDVSDSFGFFKREFPVQQNGEIIFGTFELDDGSQVGCMVALALTPFQTQ